MIHGIQIYVLQANGRDIFVEANSHSLIGIIVIMLMFVSVLAPHRGLGFTILFWSTLSYFLVCGSNYVYLNIYCYFVMVISSGILLAPWVAILLISLSCGQLCLLLILSTPVVVPSHCWVRRCIRSPLAACLIVSVSHLRQSVRLFRYHYSKPPVLSTLIVYVSPMYNYFFAVSSV